MLFKVRTLNAATWYHSSYVHMLYVCMCRFDLNAKFVLDLYERMHILLLASTVYKDFYHEGTLWFLWTQEDRQCRRILRPSDAKRKPNKSNKKNLHTHIYTYLRKASELLAKRRRLCSSCNAHALCVRKSASNDVTITADADADADSDADPDADTDANVARAQERNRFPLYRRFAFQRDHWLHLQIHKQFIIETITTYFQSLISEWYNFAHFFLRIKRKMSYGFIMKYLQFFIQLYNIYICSYICKK